MIAPQAELDRITQRRPADDLDSCSVAEAHLQQPAANFWLAPYRHHHAAAADPELVESTGFDRSTVVASGKVTGLVHRISRSIAPCVLGSRNTIRPLRLSFNDYLVLFHIFR